MRAFHFWKTEKMLGKGHPLMLTRVSNLALVLNSQGHPITKRPSSCGDALSWSHAGAKG